MTVAERYGYGECRARTVLIVACCDGSVVKQYERVGQVQAYAGDDIPVVFTLLAKIESQQNLI